jgi:hypothetical protein
VKSNKNPRLPPHTDDNVLEVASKAVRHAYSAEAAAWKVRDKIQAVIDHNPNNLAVLLLSDILSDCHDLTDSAFLCRVAAEKCEGAAATRSVIAEVEEEAAREKQALGNNNNIAPHLQQHHDQEEEGHGDDYAITAELGSSGSAVKLTVHSASVDRREFARRSVEFLKETEAEFRAAGYKLE